MNDPVNTAPNGASTPAWRQRWRRVKGPVLSAVAGLALIWGGLPSLPAAWGVRFGMPYLMFFSLAVVGSALFFVLLNWGPIRHPRSALATFASIVLVYSATVGGMVAFGYWYYPQFETPRATAAKTGATGSGAEKRGKDVFLNPQFNCFACHTIETLGIRGGQRGPDLSAAGKEAEARKPGLSAEDYLRESLLDPWACFTPLPASGLTQCQAVADPAKTYPQLMPPGLKERMTEGQLNDLVAFLRNLRGARGER
ncbi:MAG: c-type cytochrome [Betaproteobacteria bacterium]|nr:c-type cytochrome [Betaproteobacteria bacterium]MBI3938648.1 c-type cytochrome [Betaproteobacteria bacterium]